MPISCGSDFWHSKSRKKHLFLHKYKISVNLPNVGKKQF